jgi:hypothetical protein
VISHFTLRYDSTPINEFLAFKVRSTAEIDGRARFPSRLRSVVVFELKFNPGIFLRATFQW